MKLKLLTILSCLLGISTLDARPTFNKAKDLILVQHDNAGDHDDINCLAVEASMLLHPDFKKNNNDPIDIFFVAGTRGYQRKDDGTLKSYQRAAEDLYKFIFGRPGKKWATTRGKIGSNKWNRTAVKIKNKVAAVINNGGRVWVMEAGQSNFTADWLELLITESNGIGKNVTKNKIVVVQHSSTNEKNTANPNKPNQDDLGYVKSNTDYNKIGEGRVGGNGTPDYDSIRNKLSNNRIERAAKNLRRDVASNKNSNATTRSYFIEMEKVLGVYEGRIDNPTLSNGGIDFTDCVELWWIMELNGAGNLADTYNKYVLN